MVSSRVGSEVWPGRPRATLKGNGGNPWGGTGKGSWKASAPPPAVKVSGAQGKGDGPPKLTATLRGDGVSPAHLRIGTVIRGSSEKGFQMTRPAAPERKLSRLQDGGCWAWAEHLKESE